MKKSILLTLSIISIFNLLFPTSYSYWDAYSYGAQVKYNMDLFQPHHLLYNPLLYSLDFALDLLHINVDTVLLGKYMNSIFQLFNLYLLYRILSYFQLSKTPIFFDWF